MAKTKIRVTKQQVNEQRVSSKKDTSPKWDGQEKWTAAEFAGNFRIAMQYYNMEFNPKDLKAAVIKWMGTVGYDKTVIADFKKSKDWRCGITMGAIASCFLRGMPTHREDFNGGRDSQVWLKEAIENAILEGKNDIEVEEATAAPVGPVISIQDRVRDASLSMTEEIEDALENFSADPDAFDPKAFKMVNLLRGKEVKAAHARVIKGLYARMQAELEEAITAKADEQIKEAYAHIDRKNLRKLLEFYKEITAACDMLGQEAKVNRKPRVKKTVSNDKLVEKIKYLKVFEPLKLVSINPTDIIGVKELWIYNTKTRKLGRYIANEFMDLGIKGTTITGFNESASIQKTLRKPVEQLKAFKAAGKVQLRKFLEEINATEIVLTGRINEDTVLLKAQ